MKDNKKIIEFIEYLQSAYLEDRDIQKILELFDEHITFVGTGQNDVCKNFEEAKNVLCQEFSDAPVALEIEDYHYDITEMSESYVFACGFIKASYVDAYNLYQKLHLRVSGIIKRVNDTYRLYHIHLSVPSKDQWEDDFFPKALKENATEIFENILNKQNKENQIIVNSVPGGVIKCRNNDDRTLLQINDGFLELFGYTQEEIQTLFDNKFSQMVSSEDRQAALLDAHEQLQHQNFKITKYRVTCKDGRVIWIMDKGQLIDDPVDGSYFICILIDITNEKNIQEELNLTLERYRIILDQTNDIIFDWDIVKNELSLSDNWQKSFLSPPNQSKIPEDIENLENDFYRRFHPEHRSKVAEMIRKIIDGLDYQEAELKMAGPHQRYVWYKIRVTTQFNKDHQPIEAVGVLVNIDREKRQSQRLQRKAELDTLTGIYNKMSTQHMIEEALKRDENGALMILDLDYFKQINDYHGHLFGDSVLIKIAESMKTIFRDAILGRVGGDEFVIYIAGKSDLENVTKAATSLLMDIKKINAKMNQTFHLSASIGLALAPNDGKTLQMLYQKADHALYEAKNLGKDRVVLYDETHIDSKSLVCYDQAPSVISERIDSNEENNTTQTSLIEYIFRILYRSQDLHAAISNIMEIIGQHFDVSRVYIFENDMDNQYCNNTFEWCNVDIIPEKEHLQRISYDSKLRGYHEYFDQNGMFYCPDINRLPSKQREFLSSQGIKSMLQCAIYDDGEFRGYVGFDECRSQRYWTQDQISILTLLSEILSVFLLKSRAKDNAESETRNLMNVLENQSTALYVVDKETLTVLFANKKTKALANKSALGVPCYSAFLDRSEACEVCPLKTMHNKENRTIEIYNPFLDLWLLSDASIILWEGKEAYLINNQDITAYKSK